MRAVDLADADQPRVAQLAVDSPLDERDLHDDFGTHPVRVQAGQAFGPGKRRTRHLDGIKPIP